VGAGAALPEQGRWWTERWVGGEGAEELGEEVERVAAPGRGFSDSRAAGSSLEGELVEESASPEAGGGDDEGGRAAAAGDDVGPDAAETVEGVGALDEGRRAEEDLQPDWLDRLDLFARGQAAEELGGASGAEARVDGEELGDEDGQVGRDVGR
jgi:hypothetical protein